MQDDVNMRDATTSSLATTTTVDTKFSFEDLKKSMSYVRNLYQIPIGEQPVTTEQDRIDKFLSMRDLRDFLLSAQDSKAFELL